MLNEPNEILDIIHEMSEADRIRAHVEAETDEPCKGTFKLNQNLIPMTLSHDYSGKGTLDEANCIYCGYNPWKHEYVKCTRSPDFKRDTHLAPAALFKAKVLALLHGEIDGDSPHWDNCISEMIRKIEGIRP